MDTNPRIESMPRFDRYASQVPAEPWHRSGRARLFLVVFCLVCVIGLIYTALQPAVYRSSATVLMSAPSAIDAQISEEDIQGVAIQRKILLGGEITGRLAALLSEQEAINIPVIELRSLLQVESVPETNLVEMYAQGSDDQLLPVLVNNWIDVYLAIRAEDIEEGKQQTLQMVQGELSGLEVRLEQARAALSQFRQEHEIISMERQENAVLARLDGLNQALNNAIEEEAKSRAYLDTLRQAVAQGAQVVPQDERSAVDGLHMELRQLQAEYFELTKRYTSEYIQKDPRLRAIPERIGELEAALARALSQGMQMELANASQAHAAAQQTAADLQRQLDDHKQEVTRFNTIYATHQALAEDLASLEQINRDVQARQVQVEVRQVEKYPQVSVIDRPRSVSQRIGPDYLLLLGATLGAALGLAVFSVWLMGFLTPKSTQPAYVTLSGVHMYPQDGGQLAYNPNQSDPRLGSESAARIEGQVDQDGDPNRAPSGPGEKPE